MFRIPLTPLHASLLALSKSGLEHVGDRFTFEIDPERSHVQYAIETALGSCRLQPSRSDELRGSIELELHPDSFPSSRGQELGGRAVCEPSLRGCVASPGSGLPPLLEVELDSLVLVPHSRPFPTDAHGHFKASSRFSIASGKLSMRQLGGPPVVVSLAGLDSRESAAQGAVWIDGEGLHLAREVVISFRVRPPGLGLSLQLEIHGLLRGDMPLPLAPHPDTADAGPEDLPAEFDFVEEWQDPSGPARLVVTRGPASTHGLFLFRSPGLGAPSRADDSWSADGQLLSLHLVELDHGGASAPVFEFQTPPLGRLLLPDASWSLQLGYRDPPRARAEPRHEPWF